VDQGELNLISNSRVMVIIGKPTEKSYNGAAKRLQAARPPFCYPTWINSCCSQLLNTPHSSTKKRPVTSTSQRTKPQGKKILETPFKPNRSKHIRENLTSPCQVALQLPVCGNKYVRKQTIAQNTLMMCLA
jgi:hypothetical protein